MENCGEVPWGVWEFDFSLSMERYRKVENILFWYKYSTSTDVICLQNSYIITSTMDR